MWSETKKLSSSIVRKNVFSSNLVATVPDLTTKVVFMVISSKSISTDFLNSLN